jgi:hypothetical protein
MEQLVILLIIGLISLINWLMQRSAELKEKRRLEKAAQQGEIHSPPPPSTAPPPVDADPAESMRKLMEALGLPVEEAPPPVPVRREPPPILREPPPAPRPVSPYVPRSEGPQRPALAHTAAAKVEKSKPSRFRTLLSSPSGIRDAMVLSEILGKPKGLADLRR